VREGGDSVEIRSLAGFTTVIEKGDIVSRGKREMSTVPPGLMTGTSGEDLATLLAYLEAPPAK